MSDPNLEKQRRALIKLDYLFNNPRLCYVIHYSCEHFNNQNSGHSPRITSIALRNLETGQTTSFAIHLVAQRQGVPHADIEQNYDSLEKAMLKEFFTHVSYFQDKQYLHWNMRDVKFGFRAIEHRYQVLCKDNDEPYSVDDEKKVDLARLLHDIYGSQFIKDPKLPSLIQKNGIACRDLLLGLDEAKSFNNQEFVALHNSTLTKVQAIADIADLAHRRKLKTNANWWTIKGGSVYKILEFFSTHPLIASVSIIAGISSFIYGIFGDSRPLVQQAFKILCFIAQRE